MNLMNLMQGKVTYRVAYTAMLSGIYLMAVDIGDMLAPGIDPVYLVAGALKSAGFKSLLIGAGLWGIRRAMEKGGATKPPLTEEEKQAEAEKLKALLTDIEKQLQRMKA